METTQREALTWLYFGIMIGGSDNENAEWPEKLPDGYFVGREQLARAIRESDTEKIAAELRGKFPSLASVDTELLGDPVGAVLATMECDAIMCRIDSLAKRCERREDGAFSLPKLTELRDELNEYIDRNSEK